MTPMYGPDGKPATNKIHWHEICQEIIQHGIWEAERKYGYPSLDSLSRALVKFGVDNQAIKELDAYKQAMQICFDEAKNLSIGRTRLEPEYQTPKLKSHRPTMKNPETYREDMKKAWANQRAKPQESQFTCELEGGST